MDGGQWTMDIEQWARPRRAGVDLRACPLTSGGAEQDSALMAATRTKLGFNSTWSMAVGGMVGGGIFSTLGVVIGIARTWAWLSFLGAGLVALAAGYSYAALTTHCGEGGGAFTFLRKLGADRFAGSLVWILLIGYILTNAVYAYTFGSYLGHVVHLGAWFPRTAAVAIMAVFVGLNLRGVGEAGGVEIVLVWFKLAVLVALAGWGLARWDTARLTEGVAETGPGGAIFGAAAVFMAYEGFQLLALRLRRHRAREEKPAARHDLVDPRCDRRLRGRRARHTDAHRRGPGGRPPGGGAVPRRLGGLGRDGPGGGDDRRGVFHRARPSIPRSSPRRGWPTR